MCKSLEIFDKIIVWYFTTHCFSRRINLHRWFWLLYYRVARAAIHGISTCCCYIGFSKVLLYCSARSVTTIRETKMICLVRGTLKVSDTSDSEWLVVKAAAKYYIVTIRLESHIFNVIPIRGRVHLRCFVSWAFLTVAFWTASYVYPSWNLRCALGGEHYSEQDPYMHNELVFLFMSSYVGEDCLNSLEYLVQTKRRPRFFYLKYQHLGRALGQYRLGLNSARCQGDISTVTTSIFHRCVLDRW